MTRTLSLGITLAAAALLLAAAGCSRSQAQPGAVAPSAAAACPAFGPLAASQGGPILINSARTVQLQPLCPVGAMTAQLRAMNGQVRYILVVEDLRVRVQPGVIFRLSLDAATQPASLGTFNFFAARAPGMAGQPHSVSYDVTGQIRAVAAAGWPPGGLGVAIAPARPVDPGADATIGAIRLVAQPAR